MNTLDKKSRIGAMSYNGSLAGLGWDLTYSAGVKQRVPILKNRILASVLLFLIPLLSQAQDRSGVGQGPLAVLALRKDLNFAVLPRARGGTFRWKIEKTGPGEPDGIYSGESLQPKEKYAYYWDAKSEILWFATKKNIMNIKLKDWGFTEALYRPSEAFQSYGDLPAGLRALMPEILKQR